MRRRAWGLLLAAALLLSGCASMLNSDYVDVKPHVEHLVDLGGSSSLRAENYKQLVDILCAMVDRGESRRVVRLVNYKTRSEDATVEEELSAACDEVKYEDPLGSYAVDSIRCESSYIVSYYEANIYIGYRRTQSQIKSIVPVTGTSAVRQVLRETLQDFRKETVLRLSYFSGDEEELGHLVREAYYETPAAALGMPQIQIALYPKGMDEADAGWQRVAEILLTYPAEKRRLEQQSAALNEAAQTLSNRLAAMAADRAAETIYYNLGTTVTYVSRYSGPQLATAYAAIVDQRADSEGLALAYQLYCQNAQLESRVVVGTKNGARHLWNILRMEDGAYRHVDVTAEGAFALTDEEMEDLGYRWAAGEYPACR